MDKIIVNKFKAVVDKHGKRTALAFLDKGKYKEITYKELNSYRLQIVHLLQELGCHRGKRLAIMLPNSPEWILSDLAAATLGVVVVPIHTTYNELYIKKIISHSGADYLVIHHEYFEKYKDLIELLPLKKIVLVGGKGNDDNIMAWPVLKEKKRADIMLDISENDMHTIIYTSGTTGEPKGVMLSHKNIMADVESAKRSIEIYPRDRFFSFLPLSHAFERAAGYYTPITTGASIYFAQSVATLVDDIKKAKPTILSAVPRIFEKMYGKVFDSVESGSAFKKKLFFKGVQLSVLKRSGKLSFWHKIIWKMLDILVLKKVRAILGGRLRMAISGGASLDLKIIKFFNNIGINIIEGYGLTETSPIVAVNHLHDYRFGTVGLVLDCNKVRIANNKEILIKGDNVMLGYYNNQEATGKVIDKEGWFYTGDLGFIDTEGFLTIIGRAKDMIVLSTGKNIFPEPIENALNESRYILQSMVYGDRDKRISAFIVPNKEQLEAWCNKHKINFDLKEERVHNFYKQKIKEKLEHFPKIENIDNFVLLDEEFSQENGLLTPTLKLKRNKIKDRYL